MAADAKPAWLTGWRLSLAVALGGWAVTRAMLGLIGAYAFRLQGRPVPRLHMWVQWDANYYYSILAHGYQLPPIVTGLESGQSNLNFFPLLPLGASILTQFGMPPVLAGLLFANACLVAGAYLLHRMATIRLGAAAAKWSVLSLMALPASFTLSSFLTEPLFLALSVGSSYAMLGHRLPRATIASALLTVTRITGVVLPAGFALDWAIARLRGHDAPYRTLFLLALTPLPLVAYAFYMYHLTGDGLVTVHSYYSFWQQRMGVPFRNFAMFLWTPQPRLEIESGIGLVMLLVLLSQWRSFTPGEWLFVLVTLISTASSDSASPSLLRYMIVLYPLHMAMGRLASRSTVAQWLLVALAFGNGALMVSWAQGGDVVI